MKTKIFDGDLDSKEYRKLWFWKRKPLFITFVALLAFNTCFAILFAITFASESDNAFNLRMIFLGIYFLISIPIAILGAFSRTIGGPFARGRTTVEVENGTFFIVWNYNDNNYSKIVQAKKIELLEDHLYIEESQMNFIFLPKDLYSTLKEMGY